MWSVVRPSGFFHAEVVIENAESAVVAQWFQEIERFQIIGSGFLGAARADVEIAEVDQRMGDGLPILLGALDVQDFAITDFCCCEIA